MPTLELAIVKRLYFSNPQSIADLSISIGKSIPNITNAINRLLQSGLILQAGLAASTGGRRASQFIPNQDKLPNILSIAIDQFYSSAVIIDFNRQFKTEVATVQIALASTDAYAKIVKLIEECLHMTDVSEIFAIGVTIPGFVDYQSGLNNSYPVDSPLYNLKKNLQKEFNLPVFIENDSKAIAIAEHNFGVAKSYKDVMVINLNWGVGLGMILDNELYRGHSGFAGEFSHIPLSDSNKLCSCGKKGCLEVEASLLAAVESTIQTLQLGSPSSLQKDFINQKYITGEQLIDAATQGDQLAMESINRIGYILGKGISTLIHIINPQLIVISGRGSKAKEILAPKIKSSLLEFSISRLSKNTEIVFSDLNNVQLLGSACICIEHSDKNLLRKKDLTTPSYNHN